jgi:hypothetical protein
MAIAEYEAAKISQDHLKIRTRFRVRVSDK